MWSIITARIITSLALTRAGLFSGSRSSVRLLPICPPLPNPGRSRKCRVTKSCWQRRLRSPRRLRQLSLPRLKRRLHNRRLNTAAGGAKPLVSPGPRGKAGRLPPGATESQPGGAPSPIERGKPMPGAKGKLEGAATPPRRAPGGSPLPFERGKGKLGEQPKLGVTATPAAARTGTSPPELERGERPGKPAATAPPSFHQSPPPERGRPPTRRLGESPNPGATGGAENISPQGRGKGPERQRFGTPPPNSTGASEQPGGEQRTPPGLRHPGSPPPTGGPSGEARGAARDRGPGFNQPGGPSRSGPPAAGERAPGQPEGGKKKPAK